MASLQQRSDLRCSAHRERGQASQQQASQPPGTPSQARQEQESALDSVETALLPLPSGQRSHGCARGRRAESPRGVGHIAPLAGSRAYGWARRCSKIESWVGSKSKDYKHLLLLLGLLCRRQRGGGKICAWQMCAPDVHSRGGLTSRSS